MMSFNGWCECGKEVSHPWNLDCDSCHESTAPDPDHLTKDELNSQAYKDVIDCLEPRWPDCPWYMHYYRQWCPLQRFPEDEYMDDTD